MLLQIYFLHEENNTFWYQIDEGDDSYKYVYIGMCVYMGLYQFKINI